MFQMSFILCSTDNLGKMSPASKVNFVAFGGVFHFPFSMGYNPLLNGSLTLPTLAALNDVVSHLLKERKFYA